MSNGYQYRIKRKSNVTQICFRMLIHLHDAKTAYNHPDMRLWGVDDALRYKVPCAHCTFMDALTMLQDKGLVRSYKKGNGFESLYVALTPKGEALIDDKTRLMMAIFT